MAVEKEKVVPVLEAKLKGKGFPKTFIDTVAAKMAARINSDEEIDTYIDENIEILVEADKEADRRATAAATKAAEKAKQPKDEPRDDKTDLPDDTPAWAKKIIDDTKALKEELTGFKQAQSQRTLAERFKSDERLKDIPEVMFKGRIPATEEDFETAVTELAADFGTIAQTTNVSRFGNDAPGGAVKPAGTGKVNDTIKALAESINKEK